MEYKYIYILNDVTTYYPSELFLGAFTSTDKIIEALPDETWQAVPDGLLCTSTKRYEVDRVLIDYLYTD